MTKENSKAGTEGNPQHRRCDLVVIGSGSAASGVATRVRKAGRSVAVIDHRPFGGTCALRGCDPKKMLVGGVTVVDHQRRMASHGVDGRVEIDWPQLIAFKRTITDPVTPAKEKAFAEAGIASYHGRAVFTGPNTIEVDGVTLEGRNILLACGAEPVPLHIPGAEHLVDNEGFLALEALPRRVVLVGGGYIAAEFSNIAALAGAQVTVLERGKRMLDVFDGDLVGWLMEKFRVLGIDVQTDTSVEAIEKQADGSFRVRSKRNGTATTVEADLVVHAAGRAPPFADIGLEVAGIATEHGKLVLNEFLQSTTNPAIYAAGDAAEKGPPLTPVASHDAEVVATNLLEGNRMRPDYRGVPSVAFSRPPIASVGLTEAEARKRGLKFRTQSENAGTWFTARQAAEPVYGFKVLVDEGTGEVLGAHLVGPHVDSTINLFALAIRHRIKADELKATMFAYPTGASDISHML